MRGIRTLAALGLAAAGGIGAMMHRPAALDLISPVVPSPAAITDVLPDEPIRPLPAPPDLDPRKVSLGRLLFHDPRLSGDNTVACASCHDLAAGGADPRGRSVGIGGAVIAVNAPTVFNTGFNLAQFWDGRAADLEEQIDAVIHNEKEMRSNWPDIVAKLAADPDYAAAFWALYGADVAASHVKDALATFERSLVTVNAPIDRYLRGEADALTPDQEAGYYLFKSFGCASCHQGRNIGGNLYQKFGVMGDYFADRGNVTGADYGRFNVTGAEEDRFVFKVPSLRNVVVTAPYFHDGSAQTLEEAVVIMARYQLGRALSADEVRRLVAFLHALTGEYEGEPLWPRSD